jgi:hypothetical protein
MLQRVSGSSLWGFRQGLGALTALHARGYAQRTTRGTCYFARWFARFSAAAHVILIMITITISDTTVTSPLPAWHFT